MHHVQRIAAAGRRGIHQQIDAAERGRRGILIYALQLGADLALQGGQAFACRVRRCYRLLQALQNRVDVRHRAAGGCHHLGAEIQRIRHCGEAGDVRIDGVGNRVDGRIVRRAGHFLAGRYLILRLIQRLLSLIEGLECCERAKIGVYGKERHGVFLPTQVFENSRV